MEIMYKNKKYEIVENEYGHLTSRDGKLLFGKRGSLIDGAEEVAESPQDEDGE